MKKLISVVLAFLFVFSAVNPVYSSESDDPEFEEALAYIESKFDIPPDCHFSSYRMGPNNALYFQWSLYSENDRVEEIKITYKDAIILSYERYRFGMATRFRPVPNLSRAEAEEKAGTFGIVHGAGDGKFYPEKELTRGEAAVIIYNLLG